MRLEGESNRETTEYVVWGIFFLHLDMIRLG